MKPIGPNRMLRRVSVVAIASLAVLGVHTAALAQQARAADAPPSAAAPAATPTPPPPGAAEAEPAPPPGAAVAEPMPPPPPPPGYGPPYGPPPYGPPPGYGQHYGYRPGYYPPPGQPYPSSARSDRRVFMLSLGLGVSSLSLSAADITAHEAGLSYALHLGFGITPRWMLVLAMDGAWAQFSRKDFFGATSFAQTTYTIGAQAFVLPWLYARLGLGLGCLEWSDDSSNNWSDCRGQAAAAGIGGEFMRARSTSFSAEAAATVARYPEAPVGSDRNDIWYSIGLNLMLNIF